MSEDNAEIIFKIKKDKSDEAEGLISDFANVTSIKNIQCNYSRGKFKAFLEFIDVDSDFFSSLEKMHKKLLELGGEEILIEIYFDQVGESDFYKSFDGKLKQFNSLKDIKAFEKELNSRVDVSKLEFSESSLDNTALLRFHCPSQSKRKKLLELFNGLFNLDIDSAQAYFSEQSNSLLKSTKAYEVKWCAYLQLGSSIQKWYEGVPELINKIDFISEQGDYFFVGFDISHIYNYCEYKTPHENGFRWWDRFENNLTDMTNVLTLLDGVKDVMMKCRLNKFPNDEYVTNSWKGLRSQNLSSDSCWIFPANYTDQDGKPV